MKQFKFLVILFFTLILSYNVFAYLQLNNGSFEDNSFTMIFKSSLDCKEGWCGKHVQANFDNFTATTTTGGVDGDSSLLIRICNISASYNSSMLLYSQDYSRHSDANVSFSYKLNNCATQYGSAKCFIDYGYVNSAGAYTNVGSTPTGVTTWTEYTYAIPDGNFAPAIRHNQRATSTTNGCGVSNYYFAYEIDNFYSGIFSSNTSPDLNIVLPTLDLNWSGTKTIEFDIFDAENDKLDVNLYYSSSSGAKTNLIYSDTNLQDGTGITCNDYNFSSSRNCSYSLNTTEIIDGQYYIDIVVNDGTATTEKSSLIFNVDNTKPITSFSGCSVGWNNINQDINLICADDGAGCYGTNYRIDGGSWEVYSIPFTLNLDGNFKIDFYSIDYLLNEEEIKTEYCAIDKTAPTYTSIDNNGIIFNTPFDIQINEVNFDLSGKALAQYRIDGGSWENFITDYNIPITIGGSYLIDINLVDNAGNETLIENIEAIYILPPVIFENISPFGKFDKRNLIRIEFNIIDANQNSFLVDINYSEINEFGTGVSLIKDENVLTSEFINCLKLENNFYCYYDANLLEVSDGDYYALVNVQGQGFGSSNFEIYLGVDFYPSEESYVKRYINPNSFQKDENIYYNPSSANFLSDVEKQNIYLQQNTYLLIGVLIILGIGVFILWKKRK
jgi:hypothetical protein